MLAGRLMAISIGVSCALLAQPALTTIQDTLFKADGTRFNGSANISWQTFDSGDSSVIAQQSRTVSIVNGALFVQLVPNTTATPVSNYTVHYSSDGREQFTEVWAVIPSSTPLRVRNVRVSAGAISTPGTPPAGQTPIQEADVVGLVGDLALRPVKGAGFGPGRSALINSNGEVEAVVGDSSDCVRVDGSAGPCFDPTLLANFVDGEIPAGTVDGSNPAFTLANPPVPPSSLQLYRNGVFQNPGSDFTLANNTVQFAPGFQPQPGDTLLASYRVGGNGTGPTHAINTTFPLSGGGSLQSDLTLSLTDAAFLRRGRKTMVIGDSLAGGYNPDQPFPNITPLWFAQAAVESRSVIQNIGNAGALANTTQNMLDRLQTDIIAYKPDKVFIMAGYSDIDSLTPVSTIIGNITSMINRMKAANILPILCTIPPKPPIDSTGAANPAVSAEIIPFNLQLRKLAEQQGIPLVDFYNILVNPTTGRYKTGYSSDANHPQMPASKLMAQAAIAVTKNLYDAVYPWLPAFDGDGVNLIQDPFFLQTPSKWTVALSPGSPGSVAMTATIGTDPAIPGNTMTLTNTDPNSSSILTGASVTGFQAGDRLAFAGRIKSSNCEAGAMAFDVGLVFTNIAVGANSIKNTHSIFKWTVDIQDGQWYMEFTVPPAVNPALPITVSPVIALNSLLIPDPTITLLPGMVFGAGGAGSVTIGQVGLLNLTALGL